MTVRSDLHNGIPVMVGRGRDQTRFRDSLHLLGGYVVLGFLVCMADIGMA